MIITVFLVTFLAIVTLIELQLFLDLFMEFSRILLITFLITLTLHTKKSRTIATKVSLLQGNLEIALLHSDLEPTSSVQFEGL